MLLSLSHFFTAFRNESKILCKSVLFIFSTIFDDLLSDCTGNARPKLMYYGMTDPHINALPRSHIVFPFPMAPHFP